MFMIKMVTSKLDLILKLCDMKENYFGSEDDKILNKLVNKHFEETNSPLAKKCLTTGQMFFQDL